MDHHLDLLLAVELGRRTVLPHYQTQLLFDSWPIIWEV